MTELEPLNLTISKSISCLVTSKIIALICLSVDKKLSSISEEDGLKYLRKDSDSIPITFSNMIGFLTCTIYDRLNKITKKDKLEDSKELIYATVGKTLESWSTSNMSVLNSLNTLKNKELIAIVFNDNLNFLSVNASVIMSEIYNKTTLESLKIQDVADSMRIIKKIEKELISIIDNIESILKIENLFSINEDSASETVSLILNSFLLCFYNSKSYSK